MLKFKKTILFSVLISSLIIGSSVSAQSIGIIDWIYNRLTNLLYSNPNISQVLIGGTTTSTDALLEIQGADPLALTEFATGGDQCLRVNDDGIVEATGADCGSGTGGEANTASNVGTGEGLFKQKTGVDLEFYNIAATGGLSVSLVGDDVTIDGSGISGSWATSSEQYFWNNTTTWAFYDTNFARNYNATTTLNGFTPANYLAIADFGTYFATSYNATTTINGTDFSTFVDDYSEESINGVKTFVNPPISLEQATTSLQIPNWGQVSSISQGLIVKESVRVATTGNITTSTAQLIDGVNVIAGDRVLVKDQTDARRNGIYVASAGDWSRSTDYDTTAEVQEGTFCAVLEGTVNASKLFVQYEIDPVLETNDLNFTELSSAVNYDSANGISESSNVFSLGGTLIQNTSINNANYSFDFNLNGSGDFNITDNGSPALTVSDTGLTTITNLDVATGKFTWLSATSSLDYWFNATSTWAGFDTNWDRNFNATNTWAGFDNAINNFISASSTFKQIEPSDLRTTTTPSNWYVPVYESATGGFSWQPMEGGSGGASALADLTDVSLTTLATDDVLVYGGSSWTNLQNATTSSVGGGILPWQICASPATNQTWANMPAAKTTLYGSTRYQNYFDLTNAFKYRIMVGQAVAGFAGADLNLECSTNNGSTWISADGDTGAGEVDVGIGTTLKVGNWTDLAQACRTDSRVRLVGKEGDGIADPSFRTLIVEFGTNSVDIGATATTTYPAVWVATPLTNTAWANIPAARTGTYYRNFGSSRYDQKLQMSKGLGYRMVASLDTSVVPDPDTTINLECSTDGLTWLYADGIAGTAGALDISDDLGNLRYGEYAELADGCKGERYFRVVGYGGNGVIDVRFRSLSVQFTVSQDAFGSLGFGDWQINIDGQLTPTSSIDVLFPANATSTLSFAAPEFCLDNDCITSWPAGGSGGNPFNQWLDSTSSVSFLNTTSTGSSYIGGDLSVLGNASTTGDVAINGGLLSLLNSGSTEDELNPSVILFFNNDDPDLKYGIFVYNPEVNTFDLGVLNDDTLVKDTGVNIYATTTLHGKLNFAQLDPQYMSGYELVSLNQTVTDDITENSNISAMHTTYDISSDFGGDADIVAFNRLIGTTIQRTGTIDGYGANNSEDNIGMRNWFQSDAVFSGSEYFLMRNMGNSYVLRNASTLNSPGNSMLITDSGLLIDNEFTVTETAGTLNGEVIGLNVTNVSSDGATITNGTVNTYGLKITDITGNSSGSTYGIYDASSEDWYMSGQLGIGTTTPWAEYELAVAGDGVFSGDLNIIGNATSSHFAASEICLDGSCRTTWPSEGVAGNWATSSEQYFWNSTSTWAGFESQFATYYNATTTLNGFTPSDYLLTANFSWDSLLNKPATSTILSLLDSDYRISELHASSTEIDSLSFINATGTNTLEVGDVYIPNQRVAGSTYRSVNDWFNLTVSAGRISGGEITSLGANTIDVAAGSGFFRIADDDVSQVKFADWTASSTIDITDNMYSYVGVEYNSGSPRVVVKTTNDFDLDTDFPLGTATNDDTGIHILNNPWWTSDGLTNIIEVIDSFGRVRRDENIGGLIIGTTGTRNLTVTAGTIRYRVNELAIDAFDSSGADTFEYYWYDGVNEMWMDSNVSQWSITEWNDTDLETLQTLSNNWYANLWVYVESDDGTIAVIYPQAQYANSASAEAENAPTLLPEHILDHGILLGRILIQQGIDAPIETQSAFVQQFTPTQAADHGNLSGLSDDDHPQYGAIAQDESITGTWTFSWLSATSSLDYWFNSTSTWAAFDTNWNRNYNATTTLNGFTDNSTNWNTAYGWGDHSLAGYITGNPFNQWLDSTSSVQFLNATTTGAQYIGDHLSINTGESYHAFSIGDVSMIINSNYNDSDASIWFGNITSGEDRWWLDNYDTDYFNDNGQTFIVSDDLWIEGRLNAATSTLRMESSIFDLDDSFGFTFTSTDLNDPGIGVNQIPVLSLSNSSEIINNNQGAINNGLIIVESLVGTGNEDGDDLPTLQFVANDIANIAGGSLLLMTFNTTTFAFDFAGGSTYNFDNDVSITGNATTTGHFTISDGTNGITIEPGPTTTFRGF